MALVGVAIIYLCAFIFFIYFSLKSFIISGILTLVISQVLKNYIYDNILYFIILTFIEIFLFIIIFGFQIKLKGNNYYPMKMEIVYFNILAWILYFTGMFIFKNNYICLLGMIFITYSTPNGFGYFCDSRNKVSPIWWAFFVGNAMVFGLYLPIILYFYYFSGMTSLGLNIFIVAIIYIVFILRFIILGAKNFFK